MCQHGHNLREMICVDCASHDQLREEFIKIREMFDELMEYVDDAKRVAQKYGRITGEPLDDFVQRIADENSIPEAP